MLRLKNDLIPHPARGGWIERKKHTFCIFSISHIDPNFLFAIAQSAGAVEYTDCTSAEG